MLFSLGRSEDNHIISAASKRGRLAPDSAHEVSQLCTISTECRSYFLMILEATCPNPWRICCGVWTMSGKGDMFPNILPTTTIRGVD